MAEPLIPKIPLEKIAISFSGGGYRAASFHLGAMSYLDRLIYKGKPLLENVKMISTVSGGTITGVVYALKKQEGQSFRDFYLFLIGKLQTLDLVKLSIEKLNPGTQWDNIHKRKNLINAFAELYDQAFTQGATFGIFHEMKSHLEAVVFNSTDFSYGINFRFRNKGTGIFGNKYLPTSQVVAEEVKLADAIASSSCFPGGFEPIIWPHDFVHDHAPNLAALANSSEPIGIMDGGIYDNQGIESIVNYKHGTTVPYFDLVIVSDVSSPYMEPFAPAPDEPKKGLRSYTLKDLIGKAVSINSKVNFLLAGLTVVFAALPLIWKYTNTCWTGISIGLSLSFLILFIAQVVLVGKVRKSISALKGVLLQKIPPFFAEKLSHLKIDELSVRRLETLLTDRANSVVKLMSTVFLKIVRRLNYYKLYENDLYQYRRISNLIMEMTEKDYTEQMERDREDKTTIQKVPGRILTGEPYEDEIGPEIKKVAEEASGFGTTLWFTDQDQLDDKLDKLIATGQFTLCHNMLEYLEKIIYDTGKGFDHLDNQTRADLTGLRDQCAIDWKKFKESPMFLVQELR